MSTANRNSQSPQSSPAPKASRGVMNCRPCQIRKIKCDRALPACGVCHLYQRSCLYEGVPKKRGPKKESLSALIKRIDGLEELLKSEKTPTPPGTDLIPSDFPEPPRMYGKGDCEPCDSVSSDASPLNSLRGAKFDANWETSTTLNVDGLVDVYFSHFHRNPYEILDEAETRYKLKTNQLSKSALYAICAVATGFSERPGKGPSSHVSAETYATWSQRETDPDEVSVDSCQALLLLVSAFAAMGNGKRAYSVLSQAVGQAMALELYLAPDQADNCNQAEMESRQRIFRTCYILNVFVSTWLERPSLMDDSLIKSDIQSSRQSYEQNWLTPDGFPGNPDPRKPPNGANQKDEGLQKLVWMAQILSEANRYLLLSDATSQAAYCQRHKILHDLDLWASDFSRKVEDSENTLERPGGNVFFVCRLVFHLIQCLIHRPILPLRLSEPSGVKMIQHWVVEATENAFRHATAMIELIGQARTLGTWQLPPFVGFCVFTAATIFNFGLYYAEEQDTQGLGVCLAPFASSQMAASLFLSSPDLFSRCFDELSMLGDTFASAKLHRLRLEELKSEHTALLNGNVTGYVSVQSNKFFQRYSPALRQKVQGFHANVAFSATTKSFPTRSPSSMTHDEEHRKLNASLMPWDAPQTSHGAQTPFAPPRPSVRLPSSHHQGHHRSFSDSLPLSQTYSFDSSSPLSQRQLPAWPGFQNATPRQAPIHGASGLDTSDHLTSPVCHGDGSLPGGQETWTGAKDFSGGEPLSYEVLAGSVAPPGSNYQPQDGLGGSFVSFQSFPVS